MIKTKKSILSIIACLLVLLSSFTGCVMYDEDEGRISYIIEIDNQNNKSVSNKNFTLYLPTVINCSLTKNTPTVGNITPIITVGDYKVENGYNLLYFDYKNTKNATLLGLDLRYNFSTNFQVSFEGNINGDFNQSTFPGLNSLYSQDGETYIGIYAKNISSPITVSLEFDGKGGSKLIEVKGNVTINEDGFQLKKVEVKEGNYD